MGQVTPYAIMWQAETGLAAPITATAGALDGATDANLNMHKPPGQPTGGHGPGTVGDRAAQGGAS